MGLIIKDKITKLFKGYPTVADKYDVQGGVLGGSTEVKFGELVKFGSVAGQYEAITSTVTLATIAGVIVATNVKLATVYPAGSSTEVGFKPGEAINILPFKQNAKGFLAVELDSSAVAADIAEGKAVAVFLNTASKYGKFTTTGVANATDLTGAYFTGVYENKGTSANPVYVAEVAFNA